MVGEKKDDGNAGLRFMIEISVQLALRHFGFF